MTERWAGVARMGGIGDNLIASSVMRPLKRLGYRTEFITSELAHLVLLNNPFIDRLTVKKDDDIPKEGWHRWFESRGAEYDVWAHLSHSVEKRHAINVGETAFWWPQEYRRKLCAGSYLETAHDIVGVPHEFGPLFFPTDEERERAERTHGRIGGPFVTWVLAGSRLDKVYPFASHAVCRIIKELDVQVVMMGVGGAQFEYAKTIKEDVERTNSGLTGLHLALTPDGVVEDGWQSYPIRRSMALALRSSAVVTPDTGLAWAVAMEPIPKIVTVSHASAENITKHWSNTVTLHADPNRVPCWPCHRLHDDPSTCFPMPGKSLASCMADIDVETIVGEVRRAIQ